MDFTYELYGSKSSGKKISDLPSYEQKQKIMKTGQKFFNLKEKVVLEDVKARQHD